MSFFGVNVDVCSCWINWPFIKNQCWSPLICQSKSPAATFSETWKYREDSPYILSNVLWFRGLFSLYFRGIISSYCLLLFENKPFKVGPSGHWESSTGQVSWRVNEAREKQPNKQTALQAGATLLDCVWIDLEPGFIESTVYLCWVCVCVCVSTQPVAHTERVTERNRDRESKPSKKVSTKCINRPP